MVSLAPEHYASYSTSGVDVSAAWQSVAAAGMMIGMQRFVDDDRGYLDWVDHHPDGFVVNTARTPSAAYLVLHRASCGTITGKPARGITFTGEYAKVCGERNELEEFARHWAAMRSHAGCVWPSAVSRCRPSPQVENTAPCTSTFRVPAAHVSG